MTTINIVLQGKGGVGKSVIASLLAQFYQSKKIKIACYDTDPVNATFASYKAYNVTRVELLEGDDINSRVFDKLIQQLLETPKDTAAVVDNGASTFVPLSSYMMENDVINILVAAGHQVIIHTVITGGQALNDTMNGLEALIANFPKVPVVVWQNEFWGKTQMNGKTFEETKLYQAAEDNIHALITIPERTRATFGFDIEHMLKERMTFEEAIRSEKFAVMAKSRLMKVQRELFEDMGQAQL